MYKPDLPVNNLQWLICHKTKPNLITSKWMHIYNMYACECAYMHTNIHVYNVCL